MIEREVIEGEKATEAQRLVSKAAGKALRQKRAKGEDTDTVVVEEPAGEAAQPTA